MAVLTIKCLSCLICELKGLIFAAANHGENSHDVFIVEKLQIQQKNEAVIAIYLFENGMFRKLRRSVGQDIQNRQLQLQKKNEVQDEVISFF